MTLINKKSIFRDANTTHQFLIMLWGILMVALSAYLTVHYFNVKYPTGLEGSSLCDINSYFSCDTATHSPFSNILGVPISLFGMLIGVFILFGYMFKSDRYEGTLHNILDINFIGCLVLFFYSIFVLKGLCPFCTVYYVVSGITSLHFYKMSDYRAFDFKVLSSLATITLIISLVIFFYIADKEQKKSSIAVDLINQYKSLPNLGKPETDSLFRISSSHVKFADAPIQITFFSDFQCPACKVLSDMTHKMVRRYGKSMNLQYFFYPLDHNCNPAMKNPLHPLACQASYLAYCLPTQFDRVHDDIFSHQDKLSLTWLQDYAKAENVLECMQSPETKSAVVKMIAAAGPFNIRSTPTMLINGVKIEGALPLDQLFMILDYLLEQNKK